MRKKRDIVRDINIWLDAIYVARSRDCKSPEKEERLSVPVVEGLKFHKQHLGNNGIISKDSANRIQETIRALGDGRRLSPEDGIEHPGYWGRPRKEE